MNDVLQSLRLMQEGKEEEERLGFWKNHSVFQATYKLVAYRGTAEALTLLYFYERAAGIPFRVEVQTIIQLKVRVETICERTGLGRWAVSQAIATLEAAGCIRVENRQAQSKVSGRRLIHIYLLLHPQTQEPLTATPGQFGICHSNGFDRPYITCPRETREVLKGNAASRSRCLHHGVSARVEENADADWCHAFRFSSGKLTEQECL